MIMNHVLPTALGLLGAGFLTGQAAVFWNGHWYDAVLLDCTWEEARLDAQSKGGYLATIGSAAENTVAFDLVASNPAFWFNDAASNTEGPWLGGRQADPPPSEPAGGWGWHTGEPWAYANWASGEPNNAGSGEERLVFFGHGIDNLQPTWNDVPQTAVMKGYILEIPEPAGTATAAALLLGAIAMGRRRRK